jgi:hypothetical protein
MTLVLLDHIGTKGSTGEPKQLAKLNLGSTLYVPVTGQVDLDQFLHPMRGNIEDGIIMSDTSVVDENAGSAELFTNLDGCSVDCFRVGDVALDV